MLNGKHSFKPEEITANKKVRPVILWILHSNGSNRKEIGQHVK
jgi:hypothetical protein